jgi:hypothetical protein
MKAMIFPILTCLILLSFSANAQNLSLSHNGTDVSEGEVTINSTPDGGSIKVVLNITNNSSSAIDVKVKKNVRQNIEGSENTFCLGSCFESSVTESPDPYSIGAGVTTGSDDFYALFLPLGNSGQAQIMYEVFNVNNPDDKVTVTVYFNIQPSSIEIKPAKTSISAFPNPPNGRSVSISYNVTSYPPNSKLVVSNIIGIRLFEQDIIAQSGKVDVDISRFSNGLYLYSIESMGRTIITKKLIVNR